MLGWGERVLRIEDCGLSPMPSVILIPRGIRSMYVPLVCREGRRKIRTLSPMYTRMYYSISSRLLIPSAILEFAGHGAAKSGFLWNWGLAVAVAGFARLLHSNDLA
jgi:hypothetical protein